MTLTRADVAVTTTASNPAARGAHEAHGSTSPKLRAVHEGTWPIR